MPPHRWRTSGARLPAEQVVARRTGIMAFMPAATGSASGNESFALDSSLRHTPPGIALGAEGNGLACHLSSVRGLD